MEIFQNAFKHNIGHLICILWFLTKALLQLLQTLTLILSRTCRVAVKAAFPLPIAAFLVNQHCSPQGWDAIRSSSRVCTILHLAISDRSP